MEIKNTIYLMILKRGVINGIFGWFYERRMVPTGN